MRGWPLLKRSDHRSGKISNYCMAASEKEFEPKNIALKRIGSGCGG